jgi:callose synthase
MSKASTAAPAKKTNSRKHFSSADLRSVNMNIDASTPTENSYNQSEYASSEESRNNIRTLRWVTFSRAWNSIITRLRDTDLINDFEKGILVFTYFDWLSKPVYLPLFQTAGAVETVLYDFKATAEFYHKEPEPEKKILVYERFKASLDVTSAEAVAECFELSGWLLKQVIGHVHEQDILQIQNVIRRLASSEDIFSYMSLDNLNQIFEHVANIVAALKGAIGKRKSHPVITPEVMSEYKNDNSNHQNSTSSETNNKSTGVKRSVSTGFLAGLGESEQAADKKKNVSGFPSAAKPFQQLKPFRKAVVLQDSVRDKVREELRGLLNSFRGALRVKAGPESQDLVDRIVFMLSMESGFLWNDVYASLQLDELAKDSRVSGVLHKVSTSI